MYNLPIPPPKQEVRVATRGPFESFPFLYMRARPLPGSMCIFPNHHVYSRGK